VGVDDLDVVKLHPYMIDPVPAGFGCGRALAAQSGGVLE
jgi:hypothetical protein